MHCTCVRHVDLPETSRLFADVLYHPDRVAAYYAHPFRDLNDYRQAAEAVDLPDERRKALVAGMQPLNGGSQLLARLGQSGTMAVVTGQQVGLFGGPVYSIYKALHAVRLAAWLTENGISAVPVFWLATEDHDFEEVNHAWVFDAEYRATRLEIPLVGNGQPVGEMTIGAAPLQELRLAMAGLPHADAVAYLAAQAYQPGRTMGQAFGDLLRTLLGPHELLLLDPMATEFRALAAPLMRKAVAAAPELTAQVLERNKELEKAGYHAQVHMEPQTSLFFLLEDGKRLALRRDGLEYRHNGRHFTAEELAGRAESLSPNALLRPVLQDGVLPTVAYIGGPAEVAYLAQSEAIYRTLLGRMPVAVPRAGFTILDAATERLMDRYGLTLTSFFSGENAVRERIATRLVPPGLAGAVSDTGKSVETAIDSLRGQLLGFDPTLAKALETSRRKILHQVEKIGQKTGREILRRDARAGHDAASLGGLLYPHRHLQERLYSVLPLLAKHGLELIGQIHDSVQLDCPDHRLLVL